MEKRLVASYCNHCGINEDEHDRLRDALVRILQWADAYQVDVFPESDFKDVLVALKAAGLSFDQVSASNMRHVVKCIGEIARAAVSADMRHQVTVDAAR